MGSGAAAGLETTCRREGDSWVLNGKKKWIGNATFADFTVVWARDVADNQVKGLLVDRTTPGFAAIKIEDKMALRIVQNAEITLSDCRVPEEKRLPNANSFKDTAGVLRMTRAGVAWQAVGCARGAYEHTIRYVQERRQFGRPIGSFQMVQDLVAHMASQLTAHADPGLPAQPAAGRRAAARRACLAGQGVLLLRLPPGGQPGPRASRRQRDPAVAEGRALRGGRRSHLFVRGHQAGEQLDRWAGRHGLLGLRVSGWGQSVGDAGPRTHSSGCASNQSGLSHWGVRMSSPRSTGDQSVRDSRLGFLVTILALAAVYAVVGRLGLMMGAVAGFATAVWPSTGIALAALLVLGLRAWPGIALGALTVNLWIGGSIPVASNIASTCTLEELVVRVYALRQFAGF